jgi:tRNA dimethylallyltransferase
VAMFQAEGRGALADCDERDVPVLVVGGSGLHFRSLVDPLVFAPADAGVRAGFESLSAAEAVDALLAADPSAGDHVDLANPRRVVRALEIHALTGETPTSRAESPIAAAVRGYDALIPFAAVGVDPGAGLGERIERRFQGMVEAGFLDEVARLHGRLGPTAAVAVGYRELDRVIAGEWDLGEATRRAVDATTALARRQRTFHRRDPRVTWLEWDDSPERLADRAQVALEEAGWNS